MITPEHIEFGNLKKDYFLSEDDERKKEIMEAMRENLLKRNNNEGRIELTMFPGQSVDIISTNDVNDLLKADSSITNQGR